MLVFLLPVLILWIVPLFRSSLWLDETVTWWTTNHGLRELITRCTFWPGSILYNSFILALRSLGVHREWMLRLPSLLAVVLSAAILFDVGRRWFSMRVAMAAVVFFCTQPWISFAAADARPYGFGLLMVMLATWLMLRWLETERMTAACAYGVVAALIVHFHMLFGTVLVFHAVYLIVVRPRIKQVLVALAVFATLALPLVPQYLYAFSGREAHTFYNPRTLKDLGMQFLPTLPMLVSVLLAALLPRRQTMERHLPGRNLILLAVLWATVPMILLYAAAKATGSDLFVNRYLIPYVPGIALCFGLILEYLSSRLRTGLVLILFLLPRAVDCVRGEFPSHTSPGNWAAAIQYVDRMNHDGGAVPAMMRSPFPESDFFDWRRSQMEDSAIYAPLGFYRSSSEWHPLPVTFRTEGAQAIEQISGKILFFVAHENPEEADPYLEYFRAHGGAQLVGDFEGVRVFRVTR